MIHQAYLRTFFPLITNLFTHIFLRYYIFKIFDFFIPLKEVLTFFQRRINFFFLTIKQITLEKLNVYKFKFNTIFFELFNMVY